MATESFYEDLVIDTPEAAANLEALVESGVTWKRGNAKVRYIEDEDGIRRLYEKTCGNQ
ncbi:MAG: hypothetical protein Q4Q62_06895 [Thermoplasmata archaeon]|nr:hypothetical protein [Thermoplasmata archaeon]